MVKNIHAEKYHLFYKKPIYYVWFYDDKTAKRRQVSLRTRDKLEAIERTKALNINETQKKLENINFVMGFNFQLNQLENQHIKPLLNVFRFEFLKHRANVKDCSKSVMSAYNKLYDLIKSFHLQWSDLHDTETILHLQERIKGKYAQTSFERLMTYFRAFLHWALKNNYITQDICNKVDINLVKEVRHRTKKPKILITPMDFNRVLCKAKQDDIDFYWYLVFLYLLNGRESEVIKFQRKDINLESCYASLYQNKTQFVKQIGLPKNLIEEFNGYLSQKGVDLQDYVFDGGKKNDKYYYLLFRDYKSQLKLNGDFQLGQIRHFTATAVNDKFDKETAGLYLGHTRYYDSTSRYICSDLKTTFQVSCHLCSKITSLKDYIKDIKPYNFAEIEERITEKPKVS